jgi:hypothetical protein
MDDDESSLRKELWSPEEDKYDDDDDDDDALNHETFGDDIGEGMKSISNFYHIISPNSIHFLNC